MRPAPRVQAAIELLDAIIAAAQNNGAPADRLIADYFKQRRYAGSKDRRAVRELVYAAIRACGPVPASGRAAMLRLAESDRAIADLFDGSQHGPAQIGPDEQLAKGGIAPQWLEEKLGAAGLDEADKAALLGRAPLDIRVNTLKSSRETVALPEVGEALAAPHALRLPFGTSVEQWDAYRSGAIEVQDHGSQLACHAFAAQPGERVIDLCAGAGGKTLSLAAAMENKGQLLACDIDRKRLSRLAPRAERAGAGMVETRLLNPKQELAQLDDWQDNGVGQADAVLVDAPCSGTGTWRRNPENRWRLTEKQLANYASKQDELLDIAAKLTRSGGRIGFITCSLLREEGEQRIDAFLKRHAGWKAEPVPLPMGEMEAPVTSGSGIRLLPSRHDTDGFFVAILRS